MRLNDTIDIFESNLEGAEETLFTIISAIESQTKKAYADGNTDEFKVLDNAYSKLSEWYDTLDNMAWDFYEYKRAIKPIINKI